MKWKLSLFALVVFLIPAITLAQETPIPIQNPSFEAPVDLSGTTSCGQFAPAPIPGWTYQQQAGGGVGTIAWTCETPPDGKQVAYLQEATISQDLGIPFKDGVYIYKLKFSIADWFYWYPGKYKAAILMGTTELCSTSGFALGDFTEYTLPCSVPYYISHYNGFGFPPGNIVISFSSVAYWPVLVDKVSLTFVAPQS